MTWTALNPTWYLMDIPLACLMWMLSSPSTPNLLLPTQSPSQGMILSHASLLFTWHSPCATSYYILWALPIQCLQTILFSYLHCLFPTSGYHGLPLHYWNGLWLLAFLPPVLFFYLPTQVLKWFSIFQVNWFPYNMSLLILFPCWKPLNTSPLPSENIKIFSSYLGNLVSSVLCSSSCDEFHLALKHTLHSFTSGPLQILFPVSGILCLSILLH